MRNAKITPGIHAKSVNKRTTIIVAHPLLATANGGKIMHKRYRMIVTKVSLFVATTLSESFITNILFPFYHFRYFCPKTGKTALGNNLLPKKSKIKSKKPVMTSFLNVFPVVSH